MGPVESDINAGNRLAPWGRLIFGAGIILIVLRGLTLATQMPGLPPFWYSNQPLWVAVGLVLTFFGWQVLWGKRMAASNWRPSLSGRRFRTASLYIGEDCHLCDDAAGVLQTYRAWLPPIEVVDIRSDAGLTERFQNCIPVVVLDGKVRFRGRINETLLRRLIEGTNPRT